MVLKETRVTHHGVYSNTQPSDKLGEKDVCYLNIIPGALDGEGLPGQGARG